MLKQIEKRLQHLPASLTLHQWILVSCGFSSLLLAARCCVTLLPEFIFLAWNLFLAFIPYQLTRWVKNSVRVMEKRMLLLTCLLAWLLFIPNSFYIITDLFHLSKVKSAPSWFDLLLIYSFAWNGLVLGILSLRDAGLVFRVTMGRRVSFLVILVAMWLIAFGIYIGRYLRFNSWDVLTNPFSLAGELAAMIFHPLAHGYAWGMTVCYAVFLTLVYYTLCKAGLGEGK